MFYAFSSTANNSKIKVSQLVKIMLQFINCLCNTHLASICRPLFKMDVPIETTGSYKTDGIIKKIRWCYDSVVYVIIVIIDIFLFICFIV